MEKDPVCGMEIEAALAAGTVIHNNSSYCFRAPACLQSFLENPGKYLAVEKPLQDEYEVKGTAPSD